MMPAGLDPETRAALEAMADHELAEWTALQMKDHSGWQRVQVAYALSYAEGSSFSHLCNWKPGRTAATASFGRTNMRRVRRARAIDLLDLAARTPRQIRPPRSTMMPDQSVESLVRRPPAVTGPTASDTPAAAPVTRERITVALPPSPSENGARGPATVASLTAGIEDCRRDMERVHARLKALADAAPRILAPGLDEATAQAAVLLHALGGKAGS